jgi:hypothetical protein
MRPAAERRGVPCGEDPPSLDEIGSNPYIFSTGNIVACQIQTN